MEGATFSVRWLPGAERRVPFHRAAGQQHDEVCGVHHAAILLASDGFSVDVQGLTVLARTARTPGGPRDVVPAGADHRPAEWLPEAGSGGGGTSLPGLLAAIEAGSRGARTLVPLRAEWSSAEVRAALELSIASPDRQVVPLANLRTGHLWGSRPTIDIVVTWLTTGEAAVPPSDWDVGHFVAFVGTVDGPVGDLVVVRDSYPTLGWDGHHLQPPEALAAALRRGDGAEGGVALYVATAHRPDVERAAKEAGFDVGVWDNGTPWPPGPGRGER